MTEYPFSRRNLMKTTAAGVVGSAALSNIAAANDIVAEEDLLAWWEFTNGFDDAIGNHGASADEGEPTIGTYDDRDAVAFNGGDGLRVSRGGNEELSRAGRNDGPTSFSLWVYFDAEEPGSDNNHSLWVDDTGYRIRGRPVDDEDGIQIHFSVSHAGNGTPVNTYSIPDDVDTIVSTGTWHHIGIVVEAENELTMYLNGEEYFHDDSMNGYNEFNEDYWTDITIGARYGWNPERWGDTLQGKIADLRIYGSRLTESQLLDIYESATLGEPTFTPDILATSSPIKSGEVLEVETELHNTGDRNGSQTVVLESFDGEVVDSESVSLDDDGTTRLTLAWETGTDDIGEDEITVRTDDDEVTDTVVIEEKKDAATFTVEIRSTSSPIEAGETLEIEMVLENTGDLNKTGTVVLESIDGDQVDSEAVLLDGDETTTTTLEWRTNDADAGDGRVTVRNGDDEATETVLLEDDNDDSGDVIADFTFSPDEPTASQQVAFDASSSTAPDGEIADYSWEFDDGETATGEQVTHTFDNSGGYNVALTVTDRRGESAGTVEQLAVEDEPDSSDESNSTADEEEVLSIPGFGIGSAVTTLGGASYILKRRIAGQKDSAANDIDD